LEKSVNLEKAPFEILEARIRITRVALRESASALRDARTDQITVREIERALVDVLDLDEIADVLDRDIDKSSILELLADYNFARLRPQELGEVVLEESIIPPGVPVLLTEAEVKLKGEIWVVHKNDADPFPSSPHAHNYEKSLKMDLGTGDLYQRKERVPCGRMKKTVLVEFRERLIRQNSSIPLPPLAV
jgi:hypothetical protein